MNEKQLAKANKQALENDYTLLPLRTKPIPSVFKTYNNDLPYFTGGTYIQALEVPASRDNITPHSEWGFGGGESGLTKEEMLKLNTMFKFRYMGASEYERGDIKKNLQFIKDNLGLFCNFELEFFGKPIFVIGMTHQQKEITKTIEALIVNNQFYRYRLCKEPIDLDKVIQGEDKSFVGGWDIQANYLFFTDEETYLKFLNFIFPSVK